MTLVPPNTRSRRNAGPAGQLPRTQDPARRQYRIVAANAATGRSSAPTGMSSGACCYELSHHYDNPADQAGENAVRCRDCMRRAATPAACCMCTTPPRAGSMSKWKWWPVRNEAGDTAYFMETMHFPASGDRGHRPGDGGLLRPFNRMLELAKRVASTKARCCCRASRVPGRNWSPMPSTT